MMFNLYFSKKTGNRYYLGEAYCNRCKELIENNLFLNFHWSRKNKPIFETYCFNCLKDMKDHGREVKEQNSYVVVESFDSLPEDSYPIYPSPPTLISPRNFNVFEAAFVNSEAEIIDNTRLAGRSDPAAAVEFKKNKEMLEKKDEELGKSAFLLNDIARDQELTERDKKFGRNKYKKTYREELPKDNFDVDKHLEGVKDSTPLIDEEDKKLLK